MVVYKPKSKPKKLNGKSTIAPFETHILKNNKSDKIKPRIHNMQTSGNFTRALIQLNLDISDH